MKAKDRGTGTVGEFKFGCKRWKRKTEVQERLENLSLDVRIISERQRHSDERVLPDGLTLLSLRRYCV